MRRGAVVRMTLLAIVFAIVVTLIAVLIPWLPDPASEQMDRIEFAYWFTTVISIAIFAVVLAVLVYSVLAFRTTPDDERDGPHIHGNSTLEIVWTVIPAILVISIGVVSAVILSKNGEAGSNPMTINVYAQQFAWKFQYPGEKDLKSDELVMPLNRNITFEMTSADVIHSFWIPEMGQKQDLLPGVETHIVVTPTKLGEFTLICTELCGLGHATMRAPVRVLSQQDFDAWVKEQQSGGGGSGGTDGKSIFASQGCGNCHVFTPAGSAGQIGPSLDNLASDAKKAGEDPAAYIKESIVDPNKVVVSGYQPGVMPGNYGQTLTAKQIDALVEYLSSGSK